MYNIIRIDGEIPEILDIKNWKFKVEVQITATALSNMHNRNITKKSEMSEVKYIL